MPNPGAQYNAIRNPYAPNPAHLCEYTAEQLVTLGQELNRCLGPEYLSSRPGPGGKQLLYVSADKMIGLANGIFGFNGWSSSIQNVQITHVDEKGGRFDMGCSIVCRVTLKDGTYHEDIGYGSIANTPSKAMGFEKIKKEAATDAMKRALRNFGNVLGNCIYDTDYRDRVRHFKPVATRKLTEEDLHRHPDFAPVQKEIIPPQVPQPQVLQPRQQQAPQLAKAQHSIPQEQQGRSITSTSTLSDNPPAPLTRVPSITPDDFLGGAEYDEDEYGDENLNDLDFINPDEVCISPVKHSDLSRSRSPEKTLAHQKGHVVPQPRVSTIPPLPKLPPPNSAAKPVVPTAADLKYQTNGGAGTPPQDPGPARWLNPKALLGKNENDPIPENAPQFDPHSPWQGKKTAGIDHAKTGPIKMNQVLKTTAFVPPQHPGNQPRTNFVNPQSDVNRQIGRPNGAGPSPLANRVSSYKAPGPAVNKRPAEAVGRPALVDVSNNNSHAGNASDGGNHKRPRIEDGPKLPPAQTTA